jgi:hypothetical protein
MSFAAAEKIADAVLFEGYILYPYRPSAIKNQKRWNFGTLFPRGFAQAQSPEEASSFRAEMLVRGSGASRVTARVRFLQVTPPEGGGDQGWEEGSVRMRDFEASLQESCDGIEQTLDLGELSEWERQRTPASHKRQPMAGRLLLRAELLSADLYRLHAELANETPGGESMSRGSAQRSAFISAHLLLHVESGEFVSLLDPEETLKPAVSQCTQQGVFPVLAGDVGSRNLMLCSPIILYDYPQVAPESTGNFFDGTEMDEMLALRVLTLTDEEKAEMRRSDPHARAILERMETLPQDHLLKVHGAVRGMRPVTEPADEIDGGIDLWDPFADRPSLESVRVFGADVRRGDRVRLWPQKKADIMDIAMQGKVAIIEAIEQDLEDQIQFAVVLEDDPGRDMGMLRQAGHRFFFSSEEIEPLSAEAL